MYELIYNLRLGWQRHLRMYGLTKLIILSLFTVIIALRSLQAYMINKIPYTWIGGVLTVILALLISQHYNKIVFSRYVELLFFLLIIWLMMVTLINIGIYNYAADLPLDSTSIYPVFIILRFFIVDLVDNRIQTVYSRKKRAVLQALPANSKWISDTELLYTDEEDGISLFSLNVGQWNTQKILGDINTGFIVSDFNPDPGDKIIMVQIEKLDKIFEELELNIVDFVKIDIEGWEMEALRGAVNSLKKIKSILRMI